MCRRGWHSWPHIYRSRCCRCSSHCHSWCRQGRAGRNRLTKVSYLLRVHRGAKPPTSAAFRVVHFCRPCRSFARTSCRGRVCSRWLSVRGARCEVGLVSVLSNVYCMYGARHNRLGMYCHITLRYVPEGISQGRLLWSLLPQSAACSLTTLDPLLRQNPAHNQLPDSSHLQLPLSQP